MRSSWLAVPLCLALAACGGDENRNESAAADQVLADDALTGNDLTAIDAVAASDANMAADIDFNEFANNQSEDGADARLAPNRAEPRRPRPAPEPAEEPATPAEEPAAPVEANSN